MGKRSSRRMAQGRMERLRGGGDYTDSQLVALGTGLLVAA
jgi:hypothetical protein